MDRKVRYLKFVGKAKEADGKEHQSVFPLTMVGIKNEG